jgi:hypothetical protein
MIDIEAFKRDKFFVHCPTEEQAFAFLQECESAGILWPSRVKPTKRTNWGIYSQNTVYIFNGENIYYGDKTNHEKDIVFLYEQSPLMKFDFDEYKHLLEQ